MSRILHKIANGLGGRFNPNDMAADTRYGARSISLFDDNGNLCGTYEVLTDDDADLYVVLWSGGYAAPSCQGFTDRDAALTKAREWDADAREGEDTIDVLSVRVDRGTVTVERVEETR